MRKKPDYKKAYLTLMEYWDFLPDEDREEINKALKECGV